MKTLLTVTVALFSLAALAQPQKKSVVIGSMTNRPNALLIVNPQNSDQGVLLPQLSTGQRMSIKPSSPSEDGLIVYDRQEKAYFYWSDGIWNKISMEIAPKERYHTIDPVAFQQLKPNHNIRHDNLVVFESDNTFVTASRQGHGEQFIAPVNLPHGAVLQELTVYYMDNDDDNLEVSFTRKSLSGGTEEIISWESSGSTPAIESVVLSSFRNFSVIDLENYTYRISVQFDIDENEEIDTPEEANQRLYGVKIKYQE